ncbi:plasma membrane ATPase 2 [Aspergillus bombycis]|uniref:Plasma membrane ATPase 2 n=1 Tax=Aspergillus bombycis TaxID=109264 RepID=A0A1F7ZIQ6_9EURO|nr:plasma membrane ATPase 2 [Aspergillus bombycis]OGM39189.1 plasma membrane ATPase 2 [Aspergillus bombycis]
MAERRITYAPDIENSDHGASLDEYAALNRYISTARDKRRGSTSSASAMSTKKPKRSWQLWKKGGDGIEEGFRTGWNELATEKTNFFVQFIGYFRGPILHVMELTVLLAAGL